VHKSNTPNKLKTSSRSAAYQALLNWESNQTLISDSLEEIKKNESLSKQDIGFAFELSCQVMRLQRYLDFIGKNLSQQKKLPAKKKEKILLRLALYQLFFLKNIPLHAIANEMVEIAKTYANSSFANFLNAFIRHVDRDHIPETTDIATKYSYPDFFVQTLSHVYGIEKTEEILQAENTQPPLTARIRLHSQTDTEKALIQDKRVGDMLELDGSSQIAEIAKSACFYIQNRTQPTLLKKLAEKLEHEPQALLDLCAAPGGKLILLHDLFPKTSLFANDSSATRLKLLQENLNKFVIQAQVVCEKGEDLNINERFDLIIVDPPCSSSGVLYKCPEARWKITEESMTSLQNTQLAILESAVKHLLPHGKIWYLTCSIMPQENEKLLEIACEKFSLKIDNIPHTILPSITGFEGGFACQLSKR
jgi:16S rRNA (cytosine967-C5)-methyltransferase